MQSIFNDSYKEYYKIIEEVQTLNRVKIKDRDRKDYVYYEEHHVIPKSLGGSNKKSNLVLLTPEEHYICHSLLPDFCDGPSKYKMLRAWCLLNDTSGAIEGDELIGSKKYGELKQRYSVVNSVGQKLFYQTEEGKKRSKNQSERLILFYQTEGGKEITKRHSEERLLFYSSLEGQECAKQQGKNLKDFYKTEEGRQCKLDKGKNLKDFYKTEEGLQSKLNRGKKLSNFYKTEEGKEVRSAHAKNQSKVMKDLYNSDRGKKLAKEHSIRMQNLPKKKCPHCGKHYGPGNMSQHLNKFCKVLYPKTN